MDASCLRRYLIYFSVVQLYEKPFFVQNISLMLIYRGNESLKKKKDIHLEVNMIYKSNDNSKI